MSIPLKVTAITVPPDAEVDSALLNQIARPLVELESGESIGPDHLDMDAVSAALGNGTNALPWGDFYPSGWRSGSLQIPQGQKTENAANIWAKPSGSAINYDRVQTSPNDLSSWSARFSGAAGLSDLRIGTYLSPDVCSKLKNASIVISIAVRNNSPTAFRPTLILSTSNALGDREDVTQVFNAEAGNLADPNQWRRLTWTLNTGSLANFALGCQVQFDLPALTDAAHHILTSQWDIRPGSNASVTEKFTSPAREPGSQSAIPSGVILPLMGAPVAPPAGFLFAQGQAVSRTVYSTLYAAIGTTYGGGDGVNTFNLPDLRERSLVGASGNPPITGRDAIDVIVNTISGSDEVTLTAAADIPAGSLIVGANIPVNTRVKHYAGESTKLKLTAAVTATANAVPAVVYPLGANLREGKPSEGNQDFQALPFILKQVTAAANSPILTITDVTGPSLSNLVVGMEVTGESLPQNPRPKVTAFSKSGNDCRVHLDIPVPAALTARPLQFHLPANAPDRHVARNRIGRHWTLEGCTSTNASTDLTNVTLSTVLFEGMKVTGTNIPPDTIISSFPAANTVRLSKAATGTATNPMTFEAVLETATRPTFGSLQPCHYIIKV